MATVERTDEEAERISVEEMALAQAEADPEDDGSQQLVIPGTGSKLSGNVGGKKPNESYFKMRGVSLSIAGNIEVAKDTELWIAVPVAIDDVAIRNRRKDGQIVSVKRTHLAVPIGQPIILEGPPDSVLEGAPDDVFE